MRNLGKCALLLILSFVGMLPAKAEEVIYNEIFGTGTLSSYQVIGEFSGWSEVDCSYSGTEVAIAATSTYICDVQGSSKGNYLYFRQKSSSFQVEGIRTSGYGACALSFNLKLGSSSDNKEISVQCIADGVAGQATTVSATADTKWHEMQCNVEIPEAENLQLLFTRKGSSVKGYIYIDDIRITGTRLSPYEPEFSLPAGTIYFEQAVSLSSKTPGVEIHYTTDGSDPDESSPLYEQPIWLKESCTLKAVSVLDGMMSSVVTAEYVFVPVTEVSSISGLYNLESGCYVYLSLEGTAVTAVSSSEAVLQDDERGLLVLSDEWPVASGLGLSGYLVGRLTLGDGYAILSGLDLRFVEQKGLLSPVPLEATVESVSASPQDYTLRLVSLAEVGVQNDEIVQAEDEAGIPFSDIFSMLPDDYVWPELFSLTAIPLYDGEGRLVLAPLSVVPLVNEEAVDSYGTTLVVTYGDVHYAAVGEVNNKSLSARRVFRYGDSVLAADAADAESILWTIADGRIRSFDGRYLGSYSTTDGAELDLHSSYSSSTCSWTWNETRLCWSHNTSVRERTLLYSSSGYFRLYAVSNIGSTGYSSVACESSVIPGYTRKVTAGQFGSVCVPYSVDCSGLSNSRFYSLLGKRVDNSGVATELVLEPQTFLEAGYPYLFLTDDDLLGLPYQGKRVSLPKEMNGLVGVFDAVNSEKDMTDPSLEGYYVLTGGNTVGRCAAGSSLAANRAYIDLDKVPLCETVPAQCLSLPMMELPSGISGVAAETPSTGCIYTIQGIRVGETDVNRLSPGIYVQDGRKIIVGHKK